MPRRAATKSSGWISRQLPLLPKRPCLLIETGAFCFTLPFYKYFPMRLLLCIIGLLTTLSATAQPLTRTPFVIGETLEFPSAVLEETRILNVYLPQAYGRDTTMRFPVIYLLDGSTDEDFIHIAGLVQFQAFPWLDMLPPSIVVGIANVDRTRDLTYPGRDTAYLRDYPTSGGSAAFMRFIEEEVQPLIDRTYRTSASTTLIGQSLGGLFATEVLYKRPHLFDKYLIVSPSLWYDDESMLTNWPVPKLTGKSVYIAVGKEGETMERVARSLRRKLDEAPTHPTRLGFGYYEDLHHGDTLHQAAYDGLKFLFKQFNK